MHNNLPLVSIGLPIFNRPEGLKVSLDCLINQTYTNFEIIIADNCSPDPEVQRIATEYVQKDTRISYFRHETNKGWGYNTNFVIEKAKGNYFMRATDDDWWDVTFIEKIMNLLLSDSNASMGFSNFIEVDITGNKSKQHINDHLPLLLDFTSPDKGRNCEKFIKQFEGFGKSDLYFSIFRIENLRSDFVKTMLTKEVLAGDLLINLFCLMRGNLVIVPEVLMKVSFGNEKHYEENEIKSRVKDFGIFTFDIDNYRSVKKKWLKYLFFQFSVISDSTLKPMSKLRLRMAVIKRILLFRYDLVCNNTRVRYFNFFEKLKRKHCLE